RARRKIDAGLFFVGPDDGEAAALKHHAGTCGVGDRVHVLAPEYSDRRFGLLKQADCVLLTSHFEGNSVSAMETMAVGGLLIATDTTHLDEAARYDAAIVVKRDATLVAEAIARVLENPDFGNSLRRHAVDYARTHLESAVIARRMLNFYDEVLGMAFAARASA
ncbi:MAG: glycosyltransferase, partial [Gammaproteobacteria bacterium]|nr:glycosyltransferase [Gammaproteobacteria bacterium]